MKIFSQRSPGVACHSLARILLLLPVAALMSCGVGIRDRDDLLFSFFDPSTRPQYGAQQGRAVAVAGNIVVVGSPDDDTGENDSGVAKVYDGTTGALLHTLVNPTPAGADYFGYSVAMFGATVVVGAPGDDSVGGNRGSAYVYRLTSGNPTAPVATLNNRDYWNSSAEQFGSSVAISESRVAVGAPYNNSGATNTGRVYLFDLTRSEAVPLTEVQNPNPHTADQFGFSVALSKSRLVVGAPYDDGHNGRVYVYNISSGTSSPVLAATLNNASPQSNSHFGFSVAVSGTRLLVGAPGEDTGPAQSDAGIAYLYEIPAGAESRLLFTLNNPTPEANERFGRSVGIADTWIVVGAPGDGTGAPAAGSAYVYDLTIPRPPSTSPVFVTLNNPSAALGDEFGFSVAVSLDVPPPDSARFVGQSFPARIVVGAPYDDAKASGAGSAYVYQFGSTTNPTTVVATLDSPSRASDTFFGLSVDVHNRLMVVGASGVVYVYDLGMPVVSAPSSSPERYLPAPMLTVSNPNPAAGGSFGSCVAISGTRIAVGAPWDNIGERQSGVVYVYDVAGPTPTVPIVLNNPTPAEKDFFGSSVDISGTMVVVGASHDDTTAQDAGIVYVYDLARPTTPSVTLNNPSSAEDDNFGIAVAMTAPWVVVGTPRDDTAGSDAGSAYIYNLNGATPAVPVAALTNPNANASTDKFGESVGITSVATRRLTGGWISRPYVVVGAPDDDTGINSAGSAYVYQLNNSIPRLVVTLNNPTPRYQERFGASVAISGMRVVVGVCLGGLFQGDRNPGTVYLYDLARRTPSQPRSALRNPAPDSNARFGCSVAIHGATTLVGASLDDSDGIPDRGAVYLFGEVNAVPSVVAPRTPTPSVP